MGKLQDWLNVRIGLDGLIQSQLREYRVPKTINIFYTLGFVALAAFVIQSLTGFFLLVYYIPQTDHAFRSIQDIMTKVPYGWLFRQIHIVGSNLMVAVVFVHLISVLVMGSYKKPRELTWVTGALMAFTTLLFCLSGYLLPWSQLSYWATTIVTTMPTAFPYVGEFLANVLRGGDHVSGSTLGRFFALHIALLPPILAGLLGLHVFLIRRIGISSPAFDESESREPWIAYRHETYDGQPFYPHFFLKEILMVIVYCVVMFFFISFLPTFFLPDDANIPADPLQTPTHIRPEWYFLAPYQMLKLIPNKFVGIALQLILVAAFLFWPFIDSREKRNIFKRPLLFGVILSGIAAWVVLTYWGRY